MPAIRPLLEEIETLKEHLAARGTEIDELQSSLMRADERLREASRTIESRDAEITALHKKILRDDLEQTQERAAEEGYRFP